MRQYPIWNKVNACIYKGRKDYGARDTSECTVLVGTSKGNSEKLITHCTTRREHGPDWTVFTFGIDTGAGLQPLVRKYMHNKSHKWTDIDPLVQS